MAHDQPVASVVLVYPGDTAETVVARAHQEGTPRVQLLVPDGVTLLQDPEVAVRLAHLAAEAGISLVLISGDPATLEAARRGAIPTLAAEARVAAPASQPISPYSTRVLAEERGPGAAPAPGADAAFLSQIDELDAAAPPRPAPPGVEEAAAAASQAVAHPAPPGPAAGLQATEELLAAHLYAEPGVTPAGVARPAAAPPPAPARPPHLAVPRPAPARPPSTRAQAGAPARRSWPAVALALALLALLAVIAGVLLWGSRVTVVVTPPVRPDTVEPIQSLPVPIVPPGSGAATAVEAEAVRSEVAYAVDGQVTEITLSPAGSAGGTVSILNSTPQQVLLPAGTEFTAVKPDGQEVPFVSGADVLVPPATTSDTGAQIVTNRGQASAAVTARSPGSGSNVDANAIRRVTPPGGVSFNVDSGGFIIQHPPLTGGSEEEVRIVKDSDVQPLLAPALEGLDAEARRQLDGLARARGLTLEPTTILPRRSDLEQFEGFDYDVNPPIGQTVDPASPSFKLTVQSAYSGLAVPPERPLDQQLGPVLTEQLLQAGRLTPGDCRAPAVTSWRWDGESLLVDGQIAPDTLSPGCQGGLDDAALAQVREAVRGKTREEAQAALDQLVAQGLIGSYTLPDVERMPGWDWQIMVQG